MVHRRRPLDAVRHVVRADHDEHDVRAQQHLTATLKGHTQEVCGLKWSANGTMLASGGNDNLLNIWDDRYLSASTNVCPVLI